MAHPDEQQAAEQPARDSSAREAVAPGACAAAVGACGAESPSCPACGARARRAGARYCAACGRGLGGREYSPGDSVRASYRWPSVTQPAARRAPQARVSRRGRRARNERTERGYVFLAYSFVPVVGLVFCACAYACCAAGLREARRERRPHALAAARRGVAYAVMLAGAQVFIWLVTLLLPWHALS